MKEKHTFNQILSSAGEVFRNIRPGSDCPPIDLLTAYTGRELTTQEAKSISVHVVGCKACEMVVLRLETDQYFWNEMLERDQETALAEALGKEGKKVVKELIKQETARQPVFISKIKEAMVAWVTPLWQPLYAGEAVTAAEIEEQSTRFEMDYGEYINLNCHWQDEKDSQACIDLSWQANLLQPSKIWARFIDPEKNIILTEILLGTELEGRLRILSSELSFNPGTDKWAIAIIVEE
jgi:hypothetical protein